MKPNIFLTSNLTNVISDLMSRLGTKAAKVAIIKTATELNENSDYYFLDKKTLEAQENFSTFEYTLTGKSEEQLRKDLEDVDIIYVAGGNVFHLLLGAQKCGFSKLLREHLAAGKIYIGQSAGSIIAGPDTLPACRDDLLAKVGKIDDFAGFGIVDFIVLPHWGRPDKKEAYQGERFENTFNEDYKYLLLNDYQYVICTGDKISVIDVR